MALAQLTIKLEGFQRSVSAWKADRTLAWRWVETALFVCMCRLRRTDIRLYFSAWRDRLYVYFTISSVLKVSKAQQVTTTELGVAVRHTRNRSTTVRHGFSSGRELSGLMEGSGLWLSVAISQSYRAGHPRSQALGLRQRGALLALAPRRTCGCRRGRLISCSHRQWGEPPLLCTRRGRGA